MLDGLRAEFPSVARWSANLQRPALARESIGWAFVSGLGAGFIAEVLARVLLLVLGPVLFPPTQPHPEWLTPFAITSVVGGIASGAVLVRAGGAAAFLTFVAFDLAQVVAAFPSRQQLCANLLPGVNLGLSFSCDLPTIVLQRWPEWTALVVGALAARALFRSSGLGANWVLRTAGAWVLVSTVIGTTLVTIPNATAGDRVTVNALFAVGQLVAGTTAGIIAARTSRAAAAVLIALLIFGPVLAYALPAAVSLPQPTDPDSRFGMWLGVTSPLVAAVSLLVARAFARRRLKTGEGTFS